MHYRLLLLTSVLGGAFALPNAVVTPLNNITTTTNWDWTSVSPTSSIPSSYSTPSWTPTWTSPLPGHTGDCGSECGGVCGDGIVQYPYEECDLGPELNGAPKSGCTSD